jgi:voltage-gated potassium channel Kch
MNQESNLFLTGDHEIDTKRVTYVIFISSVSILSLAVAIFYYFVRDPEIKQVLLVLDTVYALMFLIDFILRYRAVENKGSYMLKRGWLGLVTTIPGFPALRIIRSFLTLLTSRNILKVTPEKISQQARDNLAQSVLYITVTVGLLVLTIGSVLIIWVEADAEGATIKTGFDAIWWSLVTVSTVGYGDEFPVTGRGRLIGVFMIVVGVALFSTITSYLASSFTDRGAQRERQEQLEVTMRNEQRLEELLQRMIALEEQIAERDGLTASEIEEIENSPGEKEED